MNRKRGKSVNFDAMVKFFIQRYGIPTKNDIEKLIARIDRMEKTVTTAAAGMNRRSIGGRGNVGGDKPSMTSSDLVLDIIGKSKQGVNFSDIQAQTGFGEKKLRNIIFRLHKMEKITRQSRGTYTVS
jgi:hypothetical protein